MKRFLTLLPGIVSVILVAKFGLLSVFVVFLLEIALLAMRNPVRPNLLSSSAGIALGAYLYPVASSPAELSFGVTTLVIAIHGSICLILFSLLQAKRRF